MTTSRPSFGRLKFALTWAFAFAIRFLPFRPANFEPVLATLMPISKRFGVAASFAFGFLSIALYDLVTSGIGEWTYVTAIAYGALGITSSLYFRNRSASRTHFLVFGIVGTLVYDALTGLTIGPIFQHQPLMQALIGQIPFTLSHVAGTVAFTLVVSPVLYRWLAKEEIFDLAPTLAAAKVR